MAIKLFGYKIGKDDESEVAKSFVPPTNDDGSVAVAGGGARQRRGVRSICPLVRLGHRFR